MTDLLIPPPIAERLLEIAEREHRSIEDVLIRMLDHYSSASDEEIINARLINLGGITPPSFEMISPPFSEEEDQALADLVGESGNQLSAIIIEERRQGH